MIESTAEDLNIALVNELAIILVRYISIHDVLEAAEPSGLLAISGV